MALRPARLQVPQQADAAGLNPPESAARIRREDARHDHRDPEGSAQQAVQSIERWFQDERDEKIGNIAASALLGFFLEEIGPLVYNRAVADVQERLGARIAELDIEFHEEEFDYWRRMQKAKKGR